MPKYKQYNISNENFSLIWKYIMDDKLLQTGTIWKYIIDNWVLKQGHRLK